eukprot:TRINITY_DN148_c0_g1_i1.p1 TRINITY_DN148_c0_g1~~TRINITY_DN148_c0_g1_i1.p1  ORF type:complete len:219 (+),score=57.49 TRINITY_DN148_c0_g1_i1:347-1003(+)
MQDVSKPTLTYFNLPALGHLPRLVLAVAGVDYHWNGVDREDWMSKKSEYLATGKFPFGQMPVYQESGGFVLSQTKAIVRYLSNKHGLVGDNEQEAALIDSVNEGVGDLVTPVPVIVFRTAEEEKPAARAKYVSETFAPALANLDRFISNNMAGQSHYFVGSKLSYADLAFYRLWLFVKDFEGGREAVAKYPNLEALLERVANTPSIKKFEDSEPYKKH